MQADASQTTNND